MSFQKRKAVRLKNFDYSQNGAYFLTICAKNKECIFGRIDASVRKSDDNITVGDGVLDVPNTKVQLTKYGMIVEKYIKQLDRFYCNDFTVDKYIIMPNHIHMIVIVHGSGTSGTPSPTNMVIPSFVSTLKRFVNKECNKSLWQRSYYDQIIRNEQHYLQIWQYIDTNSLKWCDDEYFV